LATPAPDVAASGFRNRVANGVAQVVNLSLALWIGLLAVRALELMMIAEYSDLPAGLRRVVAQAVLFDAVFCFRMLLVFLLLFLPFSLGAGARKLRLWGFGAAGTLVISAYTALVLYFATTRTLLGSDLFGYSLREIRQTVAAGARIDALSLVLLFAPLAGFWISLAYVSARRIVTFAPALLIVAAGIAAAFGAPGLPDSASFTTEYAFNVAVNKAAYFCAETLEYYSPRARSGPSVHAAPLDVRPDTATGFHYIDSEYPFLRKDETPDVLGAFFAIDASTPPNLVVISVEGLGKAFSGPNAYLGSFTPFLDELAGKSLYWENHLATQGRTFASLPSILASLPFGDQGVNALRDRIPEHLSLLSVLKRDGYRTKFYSGVDLSFDNQEDYLRNQKIDVMVGVRDYDRSYAKSPGTSWGYADRELMRKALEMDRADSRQPYVSFVQTMSMHTSYSVPDQKRWIAIFEGRMSRLGMTEAEKERHRAYKDIYSTILYTDDALRFFFEEYSRLPAYGNTIFIITGDHRLPEIPMSTKIDRYHVPLIIFSPLLKRPAHFESISSHLDIAPTLLCFLGRNYRLDVPTLVTWVGSGLDTEPSFRNIHAYPLKHTKTSLTDYISGMYLLNQDNLYAVERHMDLAPIKDESRRRALIAEFDRYKEKNDRFARELKLMPDRYGYGAVVNNVD
jgi:uncharacterized sulfatase